MSFCLPNGRGAELTTHPDPRIGPWQRVPGLRRRGTKLVCPQSRPVPDGYLTFTPKAARERLEALKAGLGKQVPEAMACLEAGFTAATRFFALPNAHWTTGRACAAPTASSGFTRKSNAASTGSVRFRTGQAPCASSPPSPWKSLKPTLFGPVGVAVEGEDRGLNNPRSYPRPITQKSGLDPLPWGQSVHGCRRVLRPCRLPRSELLRLDLYTRVDQRSSRARHAGLRGRSS
jgi:hypothetical protein